MEQNNNYGSEVMSVHTFRRFIIIYFEDIIDYIVI